MIATKRPISSPPPAFLFSWLRKNRLAAFRSIWSFLPPDTCGLACCAEFGFPLTRRQLSMSYASKDCSMRRRIARKPIAN